MEQRCSDDDLSRRDIPSFIEPRPPLIQNPFMRPRPQKATNLLEQFEEDESEIEEPELVQVYLRMKPCDVPSNLYEVRSGKCLVTSLDTTTAGHGRRTQHNVSRMYSFSRIFNSDCSQKEIFEQVVKDNLKKLVEGHSFTLLTYGASGSGKTYTLMGTVNAPGLIPRSLEYVFKLVEAAQMPMYKPSDNGADLLEHHHQEFELQWVKRLRHVSAPLRDKYRRMSAQLHNDLTISNIDLTVKTKHYVWVSFVEIYNEAIYDLLAPPDRRVKMRIREDSSGNVYVKDVTQAFVRSGSEAYDVMVAGKHNLVVAATGIHAHSSRSHCIFTITLLTENEGEIRTSQVRLCDLAGCERQRATRNTGTRMQESRAINSSLHVLERCLHMLRRKQRLVQPSSLVPYRESKLTRLLGSGLSGSRGEAISMVVTLNPAPQYAHETKHVLSLAAVAQDIQINNTMYASTLSTLETTAQDTTVYSNMEIMKLRADNERLHFELAQAQARNRELMSVIAETKQQTAVTMQEMVDEAKDMTRQFYETQIDSLNAKISEMRDAISEYEARLEEAPAAAAMSGTPTRYHQTEVTQLRTRIAILENKIAEEIFARERAEKEVQYLQHCIEERDDKTSKEASSEYHEEIVVTDSDSESEEEPDLLNESLEPVFKKDRRSHLHRLSKHLERSHIQDADVSKHVEIGNGDSLDEAMEENMEEDESDRDKSCDSLKHGESIVISKDVMYGTSDDKSIIVEEIKAAENTNADISKHVEIGNGDSLDEAMEENMEEDESDRDKSCDSLKHGESIVISKDVIYGTSDDKSIIVEEIKAAENTSNVGANLTKIIDYKDDKEISKTDVMNVSNADKDRSEYEEVFQVSTKIVMDTQEEVKDLPPTSSGADVQNDEPRKDNFKEIIKTTKTVNILRGTYFVAEPSSMSLNSLEFEDIDPVDPENKVFKTVEVSKPDNVSDTLVSKIIKSLKKDQHNDSSLTQFEQLEMAVDNVDNSKDKSTDFVDINVLTKKVNYFDDTGKEEPKLTTVTNKPSASNNVLGEVVKDYFDNNPEALPNDKKQFKSKYFEDNTNEQKHSQMSVASKTQEKMLYFDNHKTVASLTTTTKMHELTSKVEDINNKDKLNIFSSLAKNHEKQSYFDDNDNTNSEDVLISRSGTGKRTYFDIDNTVSATNRKLNDIIIHSRIDQDRSPSIVKDDIHKDYEPSSAMKKLLGESVVKAQTHAAIHKKIVKKHESVDIFESPQITAARAKEIVLGKIEPNKHVEKTEEQGKVEIDPMSVGLEANRRVDVRQEIKLEPTSSTEEMTKTLQLNKYNENSDEQNKVQTVSKSAVLEPKTWIDIKHIKLEPAPSTEESTESVQVSLQELKCGEEMNKIDLPLEYQAVNDAEISKDNTIDKFENLAKDILIVRTTEQFELLLSDDINTLRLQDNTSENKSVESICTKDDDFNQIFQNTKEKSCSEMSEKTRLFEEVKYNLRHKGKSINLANVEKEKDVEQILAQSHSKSERNVAFEKKEKEDESILTKAHSKCDDKNRTTAKRSLRLRRQKNKVEDEIDRDNENKLKDIMNLKKEFSDVTMGLPVDQKPVKDIPSPEKLPEEEEENVPPVMGIQSCPSKSVTRSRRKLFTPRAEPLEESPTEGGPSGGNERLCVPRPSYHRVRVRRKL